MPDYSAIQVRDSDDILNFEIEIDFTHAFGQLYKRLYWWLKENGFSDPYGGDVYEVRYWQRDLPTGNKEHHMWWRALYTPSSATGQATKFYTYFFDINFQTINQGKNEIMHQGKKWKLEKGGTVLRVKTKLLYNYGSDWNEMSFLKQLKTRYQKWIVKEDVDFHKRQCGSMAEALQAEIKAFLGVAQKQSITPDVYPENKLPR